ncbi:unnamed protein product [Ostreobium quekettii]|uniref:RWP-RK domain-containing protein n=1 Tax=Ostreobium quekettii TaxID=121088 RepID=A0A8S1IRM8_9CHLO|nr:unnamed protein product [Ostreobium quekettii]
MPRGPGPTARAAADGNQRKTRGMEGTAAVVMGQCRTSWSTPHGQSLLYGPSAPVTGLPFCGEFVSSSVPLPSQIPIPLPSGYYVNRRPAGLLTQLSLPSTLSPMPGSEVPQQELVDVLEDDDDGEDTDNKKNGTLHTQGAKVEANGDGRQLERSGSCGRSNEIDNLPDGGAVKGISLKDLQAQIRKSDDVAARLGIQSVTLKQICQRNGISRWPSRQTSQIRKAWHQTGYQGSPPP